MSEKNDEILPYLGRFSLWLEWGIEGNGTFRQIINFNEQKARAALSLQPGAPGWYVFFNWLLLMQALQFIEPSPEAPSDGEELRIIVMRQGQEDEVACSKTMGELKARWLEELKRYRTTERDS